MVVRIDYSARFEKEYKQLLKKYRSLKRDLSKLESLLLNNPRQGSPLGHDAYKIRLKISSKGKGKSGGGRIISLLNTEVLGELYFTETETTVHLLTIYDKSEVETISDKELRDIIKAFRNNTS